jgi:hypothetical protein
MRTRKGEVMDICFSGIPSFCDSNALEALYNARKNEAGNVYINNEAGPDFRFEGVVINVRDGDETPTYFILLTSKYNIVLVKANDHYYEDDGKFLYLTGYAVIGKDLPDGIVKFFGMGERAKAFYYEIDLEFYVEI